MGRLFLNTAVELYTAINNQDQALSMSKRTVRMAHRQDGAPVKTELTTYRRSDIAHSGAETAFKEIGHRIKNGLLIHGLNDSGWVAFHGEIWRAGQPKNGFSYSQLSVLHRDGQPEIVLPAAAPSPWEREFYPSGLDGGEETFVYGLNRLGIAVGWSKMNLMATTRPCLWRNGIAVALRDPKLENTEDVTANTKTIHGAARAINNHGAVVGWFSGYNQRCAFVWQNNRYHVLEGARLRVMPDPFSENLYSTEAVAINDSGVIAGTTDRHPVRWQNGSLVYLNGLHNERRTVGAVWSVNRHGVIVGNEIKNNRAVAALWHDREYVDLHRFLSPQERAKTRLICAFEINDKGIVVGSARRDGKPCGFVLNTA